VRNQAQLQVPTTPWLRVSHVAAQVQAVLSHSRGRLSDQYEALAKLNEQSAKAVESAVAKIVSEGQRRAFRSSTLVGFAIGVLTSLVANAIWSCEGECDGRISVDGASNDQSRAFRSTLIAAEFKALLEEPSHSAIDVVFAHGSFDRSPVGGFSYAVLAAAHGREDRRGIRTHERAR
jgi:hypothetical protein